MNNPEPVILTGDCLERLKELPDNSVDAVITDPPYGLSNTDPQRVADTIARWASGDTEYVPKGRGFMGAAWDGFVPPPAVWKECLRVLKPGGHMAVFAGARTQDLMGLSIRLAGFEIRDNLGWIYGSGFPKSMDISKAIDKSRNSNRERQLQFTEWMRSTGITAREINEATDTNMGGHYLTDRSQPAIATADLFDKLRPLLPEVPERIERLVAERTGIEWSDYVKREVVGVERRFNEPSGIVNIGQGERVEIERKITTPSSEAAQRWDGWGTALKPAIEPIILARKPLDGTVAANVLAHGVGGLNIDASRVGSDTRLNSPAGSLGNGVNMEGGLAQPGREPTVAAGRFPANVLLDEHAATEMDRQSGWQKDGTAVRRNRKNSEANPNGIYSSHVREAEPDQTFGSGGGASRFFPVFKYQAKAPKKERPVVEREDGTKIQHPTVKPLTLLEWLVTLITPPGGTVLDPFAGSGTTLQAARNNGFQSTGIEQEEEYVALIHKRLNTKHRTRIEKEADR